MRFVWAVVAFVLAALMIGLGIAQRTVLAAPEAQSLAIQTEGDAAYTLLDGDVLTSVPGAQTFSADGDGPIFAAYGRDADVTAWLADTTYNHVSLAADGTVQTEVVEPRVEEPTPTPMPTDTAAPAEAAPSETAPAEEGAESTAEVRSPVGSDLWLDEFQQEGRLTTPLQLPAEMSVLLAADGVEPAPADITLTWPVDRSTPWAGPLIIAGAVVLLVGVFLYLLGIRHARRSKGPRRKGLPLPQTEPIDLAVAGADKGVITSGAPAGGRRALRGGRRRMLAVPALATVGLLAAGCSADNWPTFTGSPTPSASASVIVPESQQSPAVTEAQAERILTRISSAVADADAAKDPALAATRLGGAALAERETNYTLRAALPDQQSLPAIPDEPVEIILPQAFDAWPRSFLSVVEGAAGSAVAPTIMIATQDDPWSEYKATYIGSLEASANLPDLAASYVGAVLAPPDSPFLLLPPDEVAAAYADIIDNGENSPFWSQFDTASDQLLAGIRADRQRRLDVFNETGEGTGTLAFDATPGTQEPLAMTTLDGGALVAVDLREVDTATPTNPDAVIRLPDNPVVQALTGVDQAARGFTATYVDQLFLYIPPQASSEQIRVLGYRSSLLEAKVIE